MEPSEFSASDVGGKRVVARRVVQSLAQIAGANGIPSLLDGTYELNDKSASRELSRSHVRNETLVGGDLGCTDVPDSRTSDLNQS